jgi:aspartate/methionine/tyrosine aminotransferase
MVFLNPEAEELNQVIEKRNPTVYELLSSRGKAIYYPRKGILAQGAAAKNKEINATIGTAYEDDGRPMVLPSLASHIGLSARDAFPYAPSEGLKPLRDRWQELIKSKNPSLGTAEISAPVVSCGVTHGLSMVGYLFVDQGEEVITSDLYWENYDLVYSCAFGARLKLFNFFKDGSFDVASFRETVGAGPVGKKLVLLNFPNNPSGYTPTGETSAEIVRVLQEAAEAGNKLAVILDDAYFGLFFEDNICVESLFSTLSHLHENLLAIKVDGLTKEEYAWGFRVGFVTYGIQNGQPDLYKCLEEKTAGAIRGSISNGPHLSQSLFLTALQSGSYAREKEENKKKIRQRYLRVKGVLQEHPEYRRYFEELPFNSGYFMCVRLKNLSAEKIWELLLDKYSTGVICYSEKNLLRIAFASTPIDKIETLFNNIYSACKDSPPAD